MSGDAELDDRCASLLQQQSAAVNTFVIDNWDKPFARVHLLLRKLISEITRDDRSHWAVFIDTNPGFSIYTRLALLAAEQLIVPFNPDEFSVDSFSNVQLFDSSK